MPAKGQTWSHGAAVFRGPTQGGGVKDISHDRRMGISERHGAFAASRRSSGTGGVPLCTYAEHKRSQDLLRSCRVQTALARRLHPHKRDDYLAMADSTRAGLIKQAHDMAASLIEIHSHLGPVARSISRWRTGRGLKETVPHMWWRLDRRPYLALVVAKSCFDALVWADNPTTPQALDGLLVDGQTLTPTNSSLWGWQ